MTVKNVRVCDACDKRGENSLSLATDTETFHLDQHGYSVDLCGTHKLEFQALWAQLVTWKEMGTVISGTGPAPRHRATSDHVRRAENREIRAWALAKGIPIGDRGRISDELREQFRRETDPLTTPDPTSNGTQAHPQLV